MLGTTCECDYTDRGDSQRYVRCWEQLVSVIIQTEAIPKDMLDVGNNL